MTTLTESLDPANLSACPSCGSEILNVQGIYACSTCRWVTPEYR
ncbi:MAG: hypothetical protein ABEI80_05820 [Haloplanus sp.]